MRSFSIDTLLLEQQRVGFFGCPTTAKEPTKASSVSDLKKKLSVKAIDPIVYQCFSGKCHKKKTTCRRHVLFQKARVSATPVVLQQTCRRRPPDLNHGRPVLRAPPEGSEKDTGNCQKIMTKGHCEKWLDIGIASSTTVTFRCFFFQNPVIWRNLFFYLLELDFASPIQFNTFFCLRSPIFLP